MKVKELRDILDWFIGVRDCAGDEIYLGLALNPVCNRDKEKPYIGFGTNKIYLEDETG